MPNAREVFPCLRFPTTRSLLQFLDELANKALVGRLGGIDLGIKRVGQSCRHDLILGHTLVDAFLNLIRQALIRKFETSVSPKLEDRQWKELAGLCADQEQLAGTAVDDFMALLVV